MLDAFRRRPAEMYPFKSSAPIFPWMFPVVILLLACIYGFSLTDGGGHLLAPVTNGFAFNSMATHMMRGRFDVDPEAITFEAFVREGRTYAYFGPWVGLARIPLTPFIDLATTDLTQVFCLLTATAAAAFRLAALRLVWNHVPDSPLRNALCPALGLALVLGGPALPFLKPSIYQEVIGWADLWATAFVYVALRGLLTPSGFTTRRLAVMAVLAGLALLTRVSTAIGLYAALGFLTVALTRPASSDLKPGAYLASWGRRFLRPAPGWVLPAVGVLLGFAMLIGFVNYERWGNPLVFADYHAYVLNQTIYLDRLPRLALYGEFNIRRIPYGLIYYFFPIWTIRTHDGFLFEDPMRRLIEAVELPPASFVSTDPLLLLLGGIFIGFLWRRRQVAAIPGFDLSKATPLLAGFAIPPILMLMAMYMSLRYRMEFYPFFVFAALAGAIVLCSAARKITLFHWVAIAMLCLFGIVNAHSRLIAYRNSPFGPFQEAVEGPAAVDPAPNVSP